MWYHDDTTGRYASVHHRYAAFLTVPISKYNVSSSAGGTLPIGSSSRRWLNQSTHSSVAYSTASRCRHGPRRWITSVLYRPMIVSANALSYESPTLPTDGSAPASASRWE